ncbi:hypothetical protein J4402_01075 [Candidatus Pacearchaeota archaeon]|nr:hypothetical protein [Candidatus Pacearchaeota archaeon]
MKEDASTQPAFSILNMETKMKKRACFLIVVLVLAGLVLAEDFTFYDEGSYIEKSYSGGQFVKGALNMSFDGQENARFESNFEGGVELFTLLTKMNYTQNVDFTCEPANCKERYASSGEEIGDLKTQSFFLDGEKIFGFVVGGGTMGGELEENGITSFQINITSDSSETSCSNQISVDLFNDGVIDFYNTKYENQDCGSKVYGGSSGCYDDGNAENLDIEKGEHYCIKLKLPAAPAYKLGARIKAGWDDPEVAMKLYDTSGGDKSYKKGCYVVLPAAGSTADADCIVNYSSTEEFDAFVCIWDKGYRSDKTQHKIREDDSGSKHCGGVGMPSEEEIEINTDFNIYALPLKYAAVGTIKFDESLNENLYDDIEGYIDEVYGKDCEEECVVPFKIGGLSGQQIILDDAKITYEIDRVRTSRNIYDVETEPFTISTENVLELDIEKMKFEVPNKDKEGETFTLSFDGEELIDDKISITKGFDFTIGPRFALIGQNTQFIAYPSTSMNISGSVWKFTDSVSLMSANEKSSYTYVEEGEQEVEVTLTSSDGRTATKTFVIVVGEPQLSASLTINKYKQRVKDIEGDIVGFDEWIKSKVSSLINLEQTKNSLIVIENDFKKLKSTDADEKYVEIINRLVALELPKSIDVVQRGTLPGEIGFGNINVDHLATISRRTDISDIREEIPSGIVSWSESNYNFEISFENIAALEDFGISPLLNAYKISLTPKAEAGSDEAYLIIDQSFSSLEFKQTYGQEKIGAGEGAYIALGRDRTPKTFEFLIAGATAPQIPALGVYISPKIDDLNVVKKPGEIEIAGFPWKIFVIAMTILIIIIFAVYIALQEWYKKYYERNLFKNPDNLYNIINFIYNSRVSGLKDREIKNKLLEKNWSRERVVYAFRKIDGKRTGMWEIPIFKGFENRKVKMEIQNKHPNSAIDARFIKRPNL